MFFLQVTKEDVIRFLEEVKLELNLLKNRYSTTVTQVNPAIQQTFPSFPLDQATAVSFSSHFSLFFIYNTHDCTELYVDTIGERVL